MKKYFQNISIWGWAAACVALLDVAVVVTLGSLSNDHKIQLRNILFSTIRSDAEVPTNDALDRQLAEGFKHEQDTSPYLAYVNQEKARTLKALRDTRGTTDRALAVAIARQLGDLSNGMVCGLESLGSTVFNTEKGIGCCSDYSKAWLFYARYLGMEVREVNTLNHTTVEFLNQSTGQWEWLDSLNRLQILDDKGLPMNQYAIRNATLFETLVTRPLMPHVDANGFNADDYEGYAPKQYSVLMWRMGTNFLEIDRWDSRLRSAGLPKSLRQMVMLVAGVQPNYLILATNALAAYLRALRMFVLGSLGLVLALNLSVLLWGCLRFFKSRP